MRPVTPISAALTAPAIAIDDPAGVHNASARMSGCRTYSTPPRAFPRTASVRPSAVSCTEPSTHSSAARRPHVRSAGAGPRRGRSRHFCPREVWAHRRPRRRRAPRPPPIARDFEIAAFAGALSASAARGSGRGRRTALAAASGRRGSLGCGPVRLRLEGDTAVRREYPEVDLARLDGLQQDVVLPGLGQRVGQCRDAERFLLPSRDRDLRISIRFERGFHTLGDVDLLDDEGDRGALRCRARRSGRRRTAGRGPRSAGRSASSGRRSGSWSGVVRCRRGRRRRTCGSPPGARSRSAGGTCR